MRTWVAFTIPVLALNLGLFLYLAPRTLPVLWQSVQASGHQLATAAVDGHLVNGTYLAVQLLLMAFPLLGWAVLLVRLSYALARGLKAAAHKLRPEPLPNRSRHAIAALAALTVLAAAAIAGHDLRPDRPDTTGPVAAAALPTPPTTTARPTAPNPAASTAQPPTVEPTSNVPAALAALPTVAGAPATYTVQPGQDLWSIAQQLQAHALQRTPTDDETGAYWAELLAANQANLSTPDVVHAGEILTLPPTILSNPPPQPSTTTASAQGDEPTTEQAPAEDASSAATTWTVHPGDSLWSIAQQLQAPAAGEPAATARGTSACWTALLTANQPALTSTGSPHLLYAGQDLTIPAGCGQTA